MDGTNAPELSIYDLSHLKIFPLIIFHHDNL